MSDTNYAQFCFPITSALCDEADRYCSSPPSHYTTSTCCGTSGEPCCIDCYYCISPITLVLDVLCFPCNMYTRIQHSSPSDTTQAAAI